MHEFPRGISNTRGKKKMNEGIHMWKCKLRMWKFSFAGEKANQLWKCLLHLLLSFLHFLYHLNFYLFLLTFLAISFSFHMWIVWTTREHQSHMNLCPSHAKCSFVCLWKCQVHILVHMWGQPITWQYLICVWKCDCDETSHVGNQDWWDLFKLSQNQKHCRGRMISNLTTTEPGYITLIIWSTVNTTLSTAALTTQRHAYL